MKHILTVGSIVLLSYALVFAHGNAIHVIGTISAISGESITVETTDKQSKTVYVSEKTKFTKSGAAATRDDLKIGERVVIHAQKQEGDKLVAETVAVGVSNATAQQKHLKDSRAHAQIDQP